MAGFVGGGGGGGWDYFQGSEPADPSDGETWCDSSDPARTVYIYSSDRAEWVPTYDSVPLFTTQEAITFAESAASVANDATQVNNGQVEFAPEVDGTTAGQDLTIDQGSTHFTTGLKISPNRDLVGLKVTFDDGTSNISRIRLSDANGDLLAEEIGDYSPGQTVLLDRELSADTAYYVDADNQGSDYTWISDMPSYPIESDDVDIINGSGGTSDSSHMSNFSEIQAVVPPTGGAATVGFDTIPTDLSAWDRLSWQYDEGDGSLSFDVEINDGSGWATHRSDVLPPVSVADVDPSTDVRLVANFSRPSASDTSPAVPYVARRGER